MNFTPVYLEADDTWICAEDLDRLAEEQVEIWLYAVKGNAREIFVQHVAWGGTTMAVIPNSWTWV